MFAMPWRAIRRRNAGLTSVARYTSPIPRRAKGSIDHGRLNPSTSTTVLSTVSERMRSGAAAASSKPTGPPMSCTTRWKRSRSRAAAAARRQAEPRQIERDAAQPPRGQLVEDLAVEERRRGHAVEAHHRVSGAGLTHERTDAGGGETAARCAVACD